MSELWNRVGILLSVPVGLFLVYLVARFIFAAYFQSKKDYERNNHGRKE